MGQVGSNANLNRIGRANGLHHYVNATCSYGQQSSVSPATMTTTVGAILGAVYLDGGLEMVEQVMFRLGLGVYDLRPFWTNAAAWLPSTFCPPMLCRGEILPVQLLSVSLLNLAVSRCSLVQSAKTKPASRIISEVRMCHYDVHGCLIQAFYGIFEERENVA